jgi:hypothetical protein
MEEESKTWRLEEEVTIEGARADAECDVHAICRA